MTLSKKVLLGLVGGIAVGLFFGEKIAFLEWPAKAFIQLLQVGALANPQFVQVCERLNQIIQLA